MSAYTSFPLRFELLLPLFSFVKLLFLRCAFAVCAFCPCAASSARRSMVGNTYANVLPVAVGEIHSTSRYYKINGITARCTEVNLLHFLIDKSVCNSSFMYVGHNSASSSNDCGAPRGSYAGMPNRSEMNVLYKSDASVCENVLYEAVGISCLPYRVLADNKSLPEFLLVLLMLYSALAPYVFLSLLL